MADKPKRRLPVLNTPAPGSAEEEQHERPPWQWVVIGCIATILGWLLMAMLANLVLAPGADSAAPPSRWALVTVHAAGFAVAAFAAGCLVGRFGVTTTRRHSGHAGALAAGVGVGMALLSSTGLKSVNDVVSWVLILIVLVVLGGGAARLGDRAARRPPGELR